MTAVSAEAAARIVLARGHYMLHGIAEGVRPLCAVKTGETRRPADRRERIREASARKAR